MGRVRENGNIASLKVWKSNIPWFVVMRAYWKCQKLGGPISRRTKFHGFLSQLEATPSWIWSIRKWVCVCVCAGHRGPRKKFTVGLNCYSGPWTNCPSSAGDKFTLPSINRGNWESWWFQRSVLPTSLTYFALSTRGYRPWRPDDFSSWVKFLMARNKKCVPSFCGVNILAFAGSIPHLYCLFYPILIHVASLTYPQTASSPVTAADRPPSCLWGWPPTPPANNRCANLLHLQIMIYNQMNNLPSIKK